MRIRFQDVGPRPGVFGASQMIDNVHTPQGSAHAAFVIQADNGHFYRDTTRQVRGTWRRADECAHLLSIYNQLTYQCPNHKPRSEDHTSELQSLAYLVCRL